MIIGRVLRKNVRIIYVLSCVMLLFGVLGSCVYPVTTKTWNQVNGTVGPKWQQQLDKNLELFGARFYPIKKSTALKIVRSTFQEIGLVVENTNYDKGFVVSVGPSPRPLSMAEWKKIEDKELEDMRRIIASEHGEETANSFFLDTGNARTFMSAGVKINKGGVLIHLYIESFSHYTGIYNFGVPSPLFAATSIAKFWTVFDKNMNKIAPDQKYEKRKPPLQKPDWLKKKQA